MIIASLSVMIVAGAATFALIDQGKLVFWIFGLMLTACVGPAQSASRSFLARVTPSGHEGEIFGLYATTGRVTSWMSSAAWTILVVAFSSTEFGILGIVLVLAIGLVLILPDPLDARGGQAALTPEASARLDGPGAARGGADPAPRRQCRVRSMTSLAHATSSWSWVTHPIACPLRGLLRQDRPDAVAAVGVETGARLVEEKDPAPPGDAREPLRDEGALALPSRHLVDRALGQPRDADPLERAVDGTAPLVPCPTAGFAPPRSHRHDIAHRQRQRLDDGRALHDECDVA